MEQMFIKFIEAMLKKSGRKPEDLVAMFDSVANKFHAQNDQLLRIEKDLAEIKVLLKQPVRELHHDF